MELHKYFTGTYMSPEQVYDIVREKLGGRPSGIKDEDFIVVIDKKDENTFYIITRPYLLSWAADIAGGPNRLTEVFQEMMSSPHQQITVALMDGGEVDQVIDRNFEDTRRIKVVYEHHPKPWGIVESFAALLNSLVKAKELMLEGEKA